MSAPDRPTREQFDALRTDLRAALDEVDHPNQITVDQDALIEILDRLDEQDAGHAAEVRALRAEMERHAAEAHRYAGLASRLSDDLDEARAALAARTPQPADDDDPDPLPAVPDGEDERRQAVLDRQREELAWSRWLRRAAETVRRAAFGPGETAAVADLIRVLDTPRPSAEAAAWSARDDGGCIRCDSTGPHVPLTSCGECGVTWIRAEDPTAALGWLRAGDLVDVHGQGWKGVGQIKTLGNSTGPLIVALAGPPAVPDGEAGRSSLPSPPLTGAVPDGEDSRDLLGALQQSFEARLVRDEPTECTGCESPLCPTHGSLR